MTHHCSEMEGNRIHEFAITFSHGDLHCSKIPINVILRTEMRFIQPACYMGRELLEATNSLY